MAAKRAARVWTEANITTLRRMANAGRSATEVAAAIGTGERGVHKKAQELGIRFGARGRVLPPQPVVLTDVRGFTRPVPSMPACAPENPRAIVSRWATCQWIDGDPRHGASCCGQPAAPGRPYCDSHAARAYCPAGTTHHDARAIAAQRDRMGGRP
jgi:hypothetical protein